MWKEEKGPSHGMETYTFEKGALKIRVTNAVPLKHGAWALFCPVLKITYGRLGAKTAEEAKAEALKCVKERLKEFYGVLNEVKVKEEVSIKKASPVMLRDMLTFTEALKKAGISFVPVPCLNEADHTDLIQSAQARLRLITEAAEAEELKR